MQGVADSAKRDNMRTAAERAAFIDEWVARGVFAEDAREEVDRYLEAQDEYGAARTAHEEARSDLYTAGEWRKRASTRLRKATEEAREALGWKKGPPGDRPTAIRLPSWTSPDGNDTGSSPMCQSPTPKSC